MHEVERNYCRKISISNIEWKSNVLATSGSSCFYFGGSAHGNFPSHSFFRVPYTRRRSCSLDGRRGVNRCDGFSAGRAIEIQEAKIAVAPLSTDGGTEINAKQPNFLRITAIFDSRNTRKKLYLHINFCMTNCHDYFSATISSKKIYFQTIILTIIFHCLKIWILWHNYHCYYYYYYSVYVIFGTII